MDAVIVRRLVKASRIDSNQREAARSAIVAYLEVLRRGACILGQRLTGLSSLEQSEDIFNLTALEMFALEGRVSAAAAAHRAAERRQQLESWVRENEPEVLTEHGDAASAFTTVPAGLNDSKGDLWRGTAVGSGRAQ